MAPDLFDIESYHYELDASKIAQYPLDDRSSSKLMVLDRIQKNIEHKAFTDISSYLREGDLLVINSSKVFPARLFGYKENGSKIEFLLVKELESHRWKAILKPAKRLRTSQIVRFSESFWAHVHPSDDPEFRILEFNKECDFWTEIDKVGHVPLPPYINREDKEKDSSSYQTIYANERGSIAAPTAGFHFTEEILDEIKEKGVRIAKIFLHVGIGTFQTVKTERIDQHQMHSEYCVISPSVAKLYNSTRKSGGRIIAVGTTSLRSLESFYKDGELKAGEMWTDIYLHPGKEIKSVDALVTNFHLPKSTLLILVSAFAGYEYIRHAYHEAIAMNYRFFSYGDAMLIK